MLECKVRRLVSRTMNHCGKQPRYLTNDPAQECKLEKLVDIKATHNKKVPPDEGGTGMQAA